jgi:ABC-2 type transport system permease protein
MTTATLTPGRRAATASTPRWSFGNVVASEFTKLLTLRSTVVISFVMIAISVGFAALVAGTIQRDEVGAAADSTLTASVVGSSISFAQLVIAVLSVLIVSNEYTTNMIQSTLLATPKRLPVLAAKLIVAGATGVVLSIVSSVISYLVTAPILAGIDVSAPLTDPKVLGSIGGTALYVLIVAVFSAAAASIVRTSAAGIAIAAGVFFVLPLVSQLINFGDFHPAEYMLGFAAQNISASFWQSGVTELAQAFVVAAVWIGVPVAAAFALLKKRDA